MKTEHNFEIEQKWIVTTPGVVFAIACAIKAFTKENEAVIIQTPVYYPFKNMIDLNNRKCVTSSLIEKKRKKLAYSPQKSPSGKSGLPAQLVKNKSP